MLPTLIEPEQLLQAINTSAEQLLLVDLGKMDRFLDTHIPGAVHVSPSETQHSPPVPGLLPDKASLTKLFQRIGLSHETHLVVYDDEGGGWAGRFIWILDEIGHKNYSYLNGGLSAWLDAGLSIASGAPAIHASDIEISVQNKHTISLTELQAKLGQTTLSIWDARSPEEYRGEKVLAARGGHIPGAVNYEWTRAMDKANGLRLRPFEELRQELKALGIDQNQEIVTHCQSHHRSGLTYLLAKLLGFPNIKAYAGSWAEWGNHPDTKIEN